MSEDIVTNGAGKKSRTASRHDKMAIETLYNFVANASKDDLERLDYKKEKGVLFIKLPATNNRESYTQKMLENLAVAAQGDDKAKLRFMIDRIEAANTMGSEAKDLYNRTVLVTLNERNKSILVPAVGTLFGIKKGMVAVTYEQGKVTITLNAPAPAAAAPSDAGTAKKPTK